MDKAKQRNRQQRAQRHYAKAERRQLRQSASLPRPPAPSRLDAALAASRTTLEAVDGMAGLRNALRHLAKERSEWAGIPMLLTGAQLVVEPSYPYAKDLGEFGAPAADPDAPDVKLRNTFWSWRYRMPVHVWEQDGKIEWGPATAHQPINLLLSTLGASDAWGVEQEARAVNTLGTLVRHRQLKQYLLTGMFMEKSERSGVHYLFRRLRPTLAISTKGEAPRILAALCLHPIAYYAGSFAGAMTPTDDVVAHLMLARGDEHLFWRRANQHAPHTREAAL